MAVQVHVGALLQGRGGPQSMWGGEGAVCLSLTEDHTFRDAGMQAGKQTGRRDSKLRMSLVCVRSLRSTREEPGGKGKAEGRGGEVMVSNLRYF